MTTDRAAGSAHDTRPERLHLVDGTYELVRAHFSKRPSRVDLSGRDIKATVGLLESLLSLLHSPEERVTHVGVAFDNPIRSFRNDLLDSYKDDSALPPEVRAQFDLVEEAVAAIGVTVWSMREHEADDALAAAAVRWRDDVDQVRILTPDKDLGQCIRGTRVVTVDRRNQRDIDEVTLRELKGIAPTSIPDWLALVGDAADGIPGIPGFGAKTASSVLATFPRLEDIPQLGLHWRGVAGGSATRLAAALADRMEDALLYRHLATLVDDLPLPQELEDLRWRGVPHDSFAVWCEQHGVNGLAERARRWGQPEPAEVTGA